MRLKAISRVKTIKKKSMIRCEEHPEAREAEIRNNNGVSVYLFEEEKRIEDTERK